MAARPRPAVMVRSAPAVVVGCLAISLSALLGAGVAALKDPTAVALIAILSLLAVTALVVAGPELRAGGDAFSPLALGALFYLLAYIAGTVFFYVQAATQVAAISPVTSTAFDLLDRAALTEGAALALLGFIGLVIGYRLRLLRAILAVTPSFPKAPATVAGVAVPLFAVGWIARIAEVVSGRYFHVIATGEVESTGSSWLVYAIGQLPLLALCYVGAAGWLAPAGSVRSTRLRTLFVVLIAIELAWTLPTGGRGQAVATIVAAGVVIYYGRGRRLPKRFLGAVALTLLLVVMPLGLFYRGDNRSFQGAPIQAFTNAVNAYAAQDPSEFLSNTAFITLSRFSDIGSLAAITEDGPSVNRRSPGETLSWVVTATVPRFVVPDKPDPGTYGNEFGRTYGIIAPADLITSISVTQVGDLFLNFGFVGVLLGMPLVGAAYRLIGDYLRDRTTDALALATYATLVWQVVASHETIVAQGLAGVLRLLALCTIVVGLVTYLARRSAAASAPSPVT